MGQEGALGKEDGPTRAVSPSHRGWASGTVTSAPTARRGRPTSIGRGLRWVSEGLEGGVKLGWNTSPRRFTARKERKWKIKRMTKVSS